MKFSEFKGMRNAECGKRNEAKEPHATSVAPGAMAVRKPQSAQSAQPQSDLEFYVKSLASEECLCCKDKLRGNSFCRSCFRALPEDMQKALYRRLGGGYEAAYDAAVVWLQKNRW